MATNPVSRTEKKKKKKRDPAKIQAEGMRLISQIIETALLNGARLDQVEKELYEAGVTFERAELLDAVKKFRDVMITN